MAKFLYSMQNVLDIKERLETQAKTEYAEMNNRLFIEEETMKRLGKRLDSYENLARSSASERLILWKCADVMRQLILSRTR